MHNVDFSKMCPRFERTFEILGRRWTGLILRGLMDRPRRFNELIDYVPGLSDRLLSERLKELEASGLVERQVHADQRPVLVEYALTERGEKLRDTFEAIEEWADNWLEATPQRHPTR